MFFATFFDRVLPTSRRAIRYFRLAALGTIVGTFASFFVLFSAYRVWRHGPSPLDSLSVRVLVGAFGAFGALGATFLSDGMWLYWKDRDNSSDRNKRFWSLIMTFLPIFGASAYYWSVFRIQVDSKSDS